MPLENCKRGLNEPEHWGNYTKASSFRCYLFCVIHQHSCLVTSMTELMLICLSRLSHGVWMMYGCIEMGIMYCAAISTEHSAHLCCNFATWCCDSFAPLFVTLAVMWRSGMRSVELYILPLLPWMPNLWDFMSRHVTFVLPMSTSLLGCHVTCLRHVLA